MKVISIKEQHRQGDRKLYFKVSLQGTGFPLIMHDPPQFAVGDDIPFENLIQSGDGDRTTYSLKTDSRTQESTEKDASIREQTAIKIVTEVFLAGKLGDFHTSNDYLIVAVRKWIDAALVHGPITSGLLEGKAHEPQTGNDK